MSCEELKRAVERVLERIDEMEVLLNAILDELRELRSGARAEAGARAPGSLIGELREKLFLPVSEVRSKGALKRALERGLLVVLRDEGANREVAVLKEAARRLLSRLPMSAEDAERLSEREYELLQILNRLGYVLLRGGQYVKTSLAEEFYT
ncbi:MAG: hypothetical protein LM577_03605 [Thermoproteaceae archaeon]|jgi:hypothetical protein|nr:hypothetical protein [Thermoproteaceae archaeon]